VHSGKHSLLIPLTGIHEQAILCPDAHYEQYKQSTDFIRKHIFPGGHLPSLAAIRAALPGDLSILDVQMMDKHYALTLDYWRKWGRTKLLKNINNFSSWLKNRTQIQHLIPSEQFFLKWDMYFSLCSALFEYNSVHVVSPHLQFVYSWRNWRF
jgi:cyclopropane fatty-acyl-phospholipid synthase-like methyltransferase